MPVHFEDYEDIHFDNAPLKEVICQIQFSPILRIANEDPVDFQESIRDRFPKLSVEQPVVIGPLITHGSESPKIDTGARIFRFHNRSESCSVTLAPHFVAFTSEVYKSWLDYRDDLSFLINAFQKTYNIQYATRIGLRYINVLTIENTKSEEFSEIISLLRDEIVTYFRISEIENPHIVKQEVRVQIDDDGVLALRFGLREDAKDEFILDYDRYITQEVETDDILERCERFHRLIYNAFRWSLAENKLQVFEPAK